MPGGRKPVPARAVLEFYYAAALHRERALCLISGGNGGCAWCGQPGWAVYRADRANRAGRRACGVPLELELELELEIELELKLEPWEDLRSVLKLELELVRA